MDAISKLILGQTQIYISYVILLSINLAIFTILFLLSLYLLWRVFKLFKYKGDPVMFWSVFTISLSLLTLVTYNSIQIYSQYSDELFRQGVSLCIEICMGYLLEVLIFISILLDLYQWAIFLATTKTRQAYHFDEKMKKNRRKLFIALISVVILVAIIFTALFIALFATIYPGRKNDPA